MLPYRQKLKLDVLFGATAIVPLTDSFGFSCDQTIGADGLPIPGSPGIPAVKVASKINEFPE